MWHVAGLRALGQSQRAWDRFMDRFVDWLASYFEVIFFKKLLVDLAGVTLRAVK